MVFMNLRADFTSRCHPQGILSFSERVWISRPFFIVGVEKGKLARNLFF